MTYVISRALYRRQGRLAASTSARSTASTPPMTTRCIFIDPDECIDCGACEPECPVTAIFAEDAVPEQWTNFIQINADYFINK